MSHEPNSTQAPPMLLLRLPDPLLPPLADPGQLMQSHEGRLFRYTGDPAKLWSLVLSFDDLRAAHLALAPELVGEPALPSGVWLATVASFTESRNVDWLRGVSKALQEVTDKGLPFSEARDEARTELAEIVCQVDLLAARLGIDLGEAVCEKLNRVSERAKSSVRP